MSKTYNVAVLVGSLRKASINRKLALALADLAAHIGDRQVRARGTLGGSGSSSSSTTPIEGGMGTSNSMASASS